MNQRLIHDTAVAMAHALFDLVKPYIPEEENLNVFTDFYVACKAGIEAYGIAQDRLLQRLNPTKN